MEMVRGGVRWVMLRVRADPGCWGGLISSSGLGWGAWELGTHRVCSLHALRCAAAASGCVALRCVAGGPACEVLVGAVRFGESSNVP